MNTQKKFAKLFGSLGVAALAALVLVTGIAAAPMLSHRTTRVRYEQYVTATTGEIRSELATSSVPASLLTAVRFEQYGEALQQVEEDRAAAFAGTSEGTGSHSGIRFEQYLWASQQ